MPTISAALVAKRDAEKNELHPSVLEQKERDRKFLRVRRQNRATPSAFLLNKFLEDRPDPESEDEQEIQVDPRSRDKPNEGPQVALHPAQRELLRDALKQKIKTSPSNHLHAMGDLFQKLDEDGSGSLDADELLKAVREFFEVTSNFSPDSQIYALFRHLDVDGGGSLSAQEIVDFVTAAQQIPKRGYRQMVRPQIDTIHDTCSLLNEVAQLQAMQTQSEEGVPSAEGAEALEGSGSPAFEASAIRINSSGKLINAAKLRADREAAAAALAKRQAASNLKTTTVRKPVGPGTKKENLLPFRRREEPKPAPKAQKGYGGGRGPNAVVSLEQYRRKTEEEAQKVLMARAGTEEERQRLVHDRNVARLQNDPESLTQMLRSVVRAAW